MVGLKGRLFIDPSAVNPNGGRPAEYGAELEREKGGRYAVYKMTVEEAGPELVKQGARILVGAMP